MAYQVIWSPEALDDIDEIAAYIAKDSPYYAHSEWSKLSLCARARASLYARSFRLPRFSQKFDRVSKPPTVVWSGFQGRFSVPLQRLWHPAYADRRRHKIIHPAKL